MQYQPYEKKQTPVEMPFTETFSGLRVSLAHPKPEQIEIADIAHHLSYINRFSGAAHSKHGCNVAFHSFWVADYLWHRTNNARLALHGLLHDAHEAYTGDLTYPMKCFPEIAKPYQEVCDRIQAAILEAFNLTSMTRTEAEMVKQADEISLAIEAYRFMPSMGKDWPTGQLDIEGLASTYHSSTPGYSKGQFLSAFTTLMAHLKHG